MTTSRPPNPNQPSTGLPGVTTYITGHDPSSGKAIVQSTRPGNWDTHLENTIGFNVIYSTSSYPASLAADQDLHTHDSLLATKQLGLVNPKGTVCRMVDFAPATEPLMHRTQSLDYGVVLEGRVEMVLDSGEVTVLERGDVAVQRATMHGWRNLSATEWARMLFFLQDCEELVVGGKSMKEDFGEAGVPEGLPPSGN